MIQFITQNWDKILTVVFACLSAIFAGISSWLLWLEYLRNNPKIKVSMQNLIFGWNTLPSMLREWVNLRIENHWRRKVLISSWHFETSDWRQFFLLSWSNVFFQEPDLPIHLEEQGCFEIKLYTNFLKNAIKEKEVSLKKLCFRDAIGNIYSYELSKKYWWWLMGK